MKTPAPARHELGFKYATALFIFVALLVYFSGLTLPLLGPDEPRYAQVAREMFARGDWITPTLGGFEWFEKPALLYWLQIIAYHIFGVSEFSARLGSAIFGLGTIAMLWLLGRVIEKDRPEYSGLSTLLAVIASSTSGVFVFAHGATFDIILTFPITAALVCFYSFDQCEEASSRRSRTSLAGFYFFCGVALLAKGLVGVVFPFAIVFIYYLASRGMPPRSFLRSLIWGTVITAATAATWYLPMYMRHGYDFLDQFIIQHHFQRYTSNKYKHPQSLFFFFWVLPLMTVPWLPFFLAAVWDFVKKTIWHVGWLPGNGGGLSSLQIFSVVWILVPLLFFEFSGSKLPGYILPGVPGAIVLTALLINRLLKKRRIFLFGTYAIAVGTFAFVFIALFFYAPRLADADSVRSLIAASDEQGFQTAPVISFRRLSHNAEFYAAGRLVRDADGRQHNFYTAAEVANFMTQNSGQNVLILTPLRDAPELTSSQEIHGEVLADNGDIAIVVASEDK